MFRVYFSEIVSPKFEKEIIFKKDDVEIDELVGNGRVSITILKSTSIYELKGSIEFRLNLQCARCLEYFEKDYKENFELIVRREQAKFEKELELKEEDINTIFVNNEFIDLTRIIRDYIILSIPMKPLCSSECKGICDVCGANLNKIDCGHTLKQNIDPRWEKLYEMLGGEHGSTKEKSVKNKRKKKKDTLQIKGTNTH